MVASAAGDRATDSSGGGQRSSDVSKARRRGLADRLFTRIDQWLAPILRRRAWKRLDNTIKGFRCELGARGMDTQVAHVQPHIEHALTAAETALHQGDIDGGWRQFFLAHRLTLLGCDQAGLGAVAVAMRAEADKLSPWRKKAVLDLLPTGDAKEEHRMQIFQATLLRDEHYSNEAYKDGIRLASALWLALALLIGLVLLLYIVHAGLLTTTLAYTSGTDATQLYDVLLSIAVFGFLGAAMSTLTTPAQSNSSSRIPEMINSFRVTMLRLLVGPVSAIVVFFTVQSSLYSAVIKEKPESYALLVVAFVAGFTERLVRRVVETVAGKA